MSLFGTSPSDESPVGDSDNILPRSSLFDDEPDTLQTSNSLFEDDDSNGSPWDMPTPRKQQSRADLVRSLLPASDAPDSYLDIFDAVVRDGGGSGGRVTAGGIARVLAAARIGADNQARVMSLVTPGGSSGSVALARDEFNVFLALVGLAQEGEAVSLDGVDERRRNLPQLKLPGLDDQAPVLPGLSELAAKPPQRPVTPPQAHTPPSPPQQQRAAGNESMDYPEDPWNSPDVHKDHAHQADRQDATSSHAPPAHAPPSPAVNGSSGYGAAASEQGLPRTTSNFTTDSTGPGGAKPAPLGGAESLSDRPGAGWGYYSNDTAGNFNESLPPDAAPVASPFSGTAGAADEAAGPLSLPPARAIRAGGAGAVEENVVVALMPEKEGLFLFQHHNYEVSSRRRGSKVVRRYSDFVWLLDCLHKRYPFRALPLLPPKRVAVNGNHLSNDGAFIEKRRRGLARFLNGLVRHPVLSQEQLVVMFLTVPTELSVWRKQATISVQDEFIGRSLPPGLEESLSPGLEELFERSRSGISRSAELYINTCSVMDRLVKRYIGVAADHARIAMSLTSATEASADTYATDTNDVPLLNDGLQAMSKHLRTGQMLMEDEARAWDEGVLEDLKRQRDDLVSMREMFERRDRLDKDNIPYLEKRIHTNEAKLASLRSKPEGTVKPGEIDRVVGAIIKDKESIVSQHSRSVFVRECIRDELVHFQTTQYHVTRWNQDWSQERVKYAEMLADNWRRLMDELEGMPTGE